jgi:predicted metalloprotease with PDZ domain
MRAFVTFLVVALLAIARPAYAQQFTPAASLATEQNPMTLVVDARQIARGVLFVHETMPVKSGTFRIEYPQWVPGEHGPSGPLYDLASLRVSSGSTPVAWHRDDVDMYAFHLDVPQAVTSVTLDFYVLLNAPGDIMSTAALAIINWNRVLLYQHGIDSAQYWVKASVMLPPAWQFGTALRVQSQSSGRVDFATTAIVNFVDSPMDLGEYVKKWTLWKDGTAFVELDAFADDPKDLEIMPSILSGYERVPAEAFALYGSRHFADYHALLTLSNSIPFQGIEHHQSSDNRSDNDFLTNSQANVAFADLVTHEFSHSWNGKYRRPYDLTTPNFQVPQKTDLLWVYEGMNQYLGDLIAFRAGLRDPKTYPDLVAADYGLMAAESGRKTTPIIDLTTGAPYFYYEHGDYDSIRRMANDFYTEGHLLWLDVDTIIRERSHGARSLDTFLHRYTQPALTGPIVKTYTRAEIESLLNDVEPYDWHGFFDRHVYTTTVNPPEDEIARSGYKLVWNQTQNPYLVRDDLIYRDGLSAWFSLGFVTDSKNVVLDVREGSPAWDAGLVPKETILAIDGYAVDKGRLDYSLRTAQHSNAPIALLVQRDSSFAVLSLNYHDGPRFPHLERISGTADMLSAIAAPHAK